MSEAVMVALISAVSGIIIALINGHESHKSEDDVDTVSYTHLTLPTNREV